MEKTKIKDKKEKSVPAVPIAPAKTEARAIGRYLKITPTKVRDFARLIRGKRVVVAETILKFSGTRGGETVADVLHSASANAGAGFDKETWLVAEVRADKGPTFRRRVDPKSRGSRGMIISPSTHLMVVLKKIADRDERSNSGS
jgi:large subunit ribosomal protein L22